MGILHRQRWCGATGLAVPLLTLASPGFLTIAGVGPSWAVLWLLPWALVDGPASGAVAGLALGLVLDGLHLGSATQVPVLLLLGWWWGRLGRRGAPIERSFNLGLLALLGTALLGASLLLQLHGQGAMLQPLARLHTLVAQSLITALLAPMVCSLLLLRWRQVASLRS
jgi:rod shape-determining protein MreD